MRFVCCQNAPYPPYYIIATKTWGSDEIRQRASTGTRQFVVITAATNGLPVTVPHQEMILIVDSRSKRHLIDDGYIHIKAASVVESRGDPITSQRVTLCAQWEELLLSATSDV
jgi:hypothetical protein